MGAVRVVVLTLDGTQQGEHALRIQRGPRQHDLEQSAHPPNSALVVVEAALALALLRGPLHRSARGTALGESLLGSTAHHCSAAETAARSGHSRPPDRP